MKTKLIIFLSLIFLLPFFASAHVKWFVDPSAVLPIDPYSLADWQVLLGIILAMVAVAIAFMLERKLLPLDKTLDHHYEEPIRVLWIYEGEALHIELSCDY